MSNIPSKLRKQLAEDPYYRTCAREGLHGHECAGRITWEHAIICAGKQLQERFAIIPLCAKAHGVDSFQDGGDLKKEINVWIALNRGNDEELLSISRAQDMFMHRTWLNKKYGVYVPVEYDSVSPRIMYPWMRHARSVV